MKNIFIFGFTAFFLFVATPSFSASIQKAEMLNKHNLIKEAKQELIEIIFEGEGGILGGNKGEDVAQAYYLLGTIAFKEDDASLALDTWEKLVKEYPNSEQAKIVSKDIEELSEVVTESRDSLIENALARSYLRHGDFWSKGRDTRFIVDTSWLPNVEMATNWYDIVIKKFPNTQAAETAYESKMLTLIGWTEKSYDYTSRYGVDSSFLKYMPLLVKTFEDFSRDFPNATSLQAFRFQIAQAYWGQSVSVQARKVENWEEAKKWLNKIIEVAGDNDSFYKDLAKNRLAIPKG